MKRIIIPILFCLVQFGYGQSVISINGGNAEPKASVNSRQGVFNVLDNSAKADGTDDQPEIQNAITAGTGKTVYMPQGTYYITNPLHIGSNTVLKGAGTGKTILVCRSDWSKNYGGMIEFLVGTKHVKIEGMTLNGNNGVVTNKNQSGISNYNTTLSHHINLNDIEIKDVEILNTSAFGVAFSDSLVNKVKMEDLFVHHTGFGGAGNHQGGLFFLNSANVTIDKCVVDSSYEHGIYLSSGHDYIITNSFFRENGGDGMSIRADSNTVIMGNLIEHNSFTGISTVRTSGYFSHGSKVRNVLISNNVIKDNLGVSQVAGQLVIDYSQNLNISDNVIMIKNKGTGSFKGIRVYQDNKDVAIDNNTIIAPYPIEIFSDTINNISVTNNRLYNMQGDEMTNPVNAVLLYQSNINSSNIFIKDNYIKGGTNAIRAASGWYGWNTVIEDNKIQGGVINITDSPVAITQTDNSFSYLSPFLYDTISFNSVQPGTLNQVTMVLRTMSTKDTVYVNWGEDAVVKVCGTTDQTIVSDYGTTSHTYPIAIYGDLSKLTKLVIANEATVQAVKSSQITACTGMTYLQFSDLSATGHVINSSDLVGLPLTYLRLSYLSTTGITINTANFVGMPLATLFLSNIGTSGHTINTANLVGLPLTYVVFSNLGTTTCTGQISDLPTGLTDLTISNCGQGISISSGTMKAWASTIITLTSAYTTASVDGFLNAWATPAGTGTKTITLSGSGAGIANQARSSASDAAVTTLQGKGKTIVTTP
jgi:hypothetical protein